MYVAVEVNQWHAFEKGVYAEADDESCDGVNGVVVAMALVGMVVVVVFAGLMLFFAAGAVVVSVFGSAGKLFEEQLNEESYHDGGSYLEVYAGCDETERVVAKEDVWHEVDEA